MTAIEQTVFSEYEARKVNVIIGQEVGTIKCLGKIEEEATVRTVTKNCRGVVAKTITRGTGSGVITISAHIPIALYRKMLSMADESLVTGVYTYGRNSLHPNFTLTADVFDEDDNEKLKAWPVCNMNTGGQSVIENGAEEVAEVEIEVAYSPDDYGNGFYEALVADLSDDTIKTDWMEKFTPELVHIEEV